jgi:two-component system, OmpR family, sensor kinase
MADAEAERTPAHPIWHPHRWPLRWRLTAVLAGLTCLILVVFAVVVGRLASNRLHSDFDNELMQSAQSIAAQVPTANLFEGTPIHVPRFSDMTTAPQAVVCLRYANGRPVPHYCTVPASRLGPLHPGLLRAERADTATVAVRSGPLGSPIYVQYARSTSSVDATIGRLWLFLIAGIIAGTILAAVAGYALAGRTLRPVSQLTATARKVAATRDPSRRIPEPEAQDEVAELARTLDKMLRELEAARAETNQMIQAQRDFVADASHELRTPLTSILANLELLQDRLEEERAGSEDGEMVAGALASSRRMSRLVSDLLLLARADAGRIGSRRECDLAEIGAGALSEVRAVADGHALSFDADGPVAVRGNPDELHRLALNLLENGLRHTPPGTEVSLAVERRNGEAVLEVSDDGPGLPPALGEQLFARFVRGSGPADTSPADGAGLGLAIVKAVATGHGGDVEAGRSAAGGARFTVRLPLLDGSERDPPSNGSATSAPASDRAAEKF